MSASCYLDQAIHGATYEHKATLFGEETINLVAGQVCKKERISCGKSHGGHMGEVVDKGACGEGLQMEHAGKGFKWSMWGRASNGACGEGLQMEHVGEGFKWSMWGRASNGACGEGLQMEHVGKGFKWSMWGRASNGACGEGLQMEHVRMAFKWSMWKGGVGGRTSMEHMGEGLRSKENIHGGLDWCKKNINILYMNLVTQTFYIHTLNER